jgi:hypothetical protein
MPVVFCSQPDITGFVCATALTADNKIAVVIIFFMRVKLGFVVL